MKKILSLFFLLCAVCSISAKDVIVKKNADVVEAKILEVSSDEIKYKKLSNPKGPTFTISISDVSTVIYENGEVESFTKKEPTKDEKVVENNTTNNNTTMGSIANNDNTMDTNILYPIIVGKSNYEMNGKVMTRKDVEAFLKDNCATAYNKWADGTMKLTAGYTFASCGVTCCIISIAAGSRYANSNYTNVTAGAIRTACLIVGLSSDIAAIPFLISGSKCRQKSINIYNENCATKNSSFEMKMNFKGNGLGLSMSF